MWPYQQRDPWPYLRGREYQTVSKPIFVEFLTLFIRSANSEKCFRFLSLTNVQGKDYSAQLKVASNLATLYLLSLFIGNYNQTGKHKNSKNCKNY